MEKIEEGECPKCKSENNVKIVYGYPSPETMKKFEEGKIELGGCEVYETNFTRHCKDCGKNFLRKKFFKKEVGL